ncbi:MAG: hypothetical protein HS119_11845 [Flavobacteriales bacterium]|nr:hypothetical protein [Flavobacteriales bacterium]
MSKIDDVFELVKSLTKNEKRFFKIFSKRHGEKDDLKYLQLFDIYDSFAVFEKENIEQEIRIKNLTNIRNIKHQLNLQILRCLNTYHYQKTIENEVFNHLQNGQILFEKGLFNHAYKAINQAKNLAKKHNLNLLLLDCLKKEKQIARELYIKEKIEYFASEGLSEEKELLNQYLKTCETLHLRNQLILTSRESKNIDKNQLKLQTKAIENQVLALKIDENTSFENAEAALITQSYFYISNQDFKSAAEVQQQLKELYKIYPEQIELQHSNYLSALYNLMVSCLILKKFEKVETILNTINAYRLKQNSRLVNLKLFTYLNIGLAFYNKKGDFVKSSSYETDINQGLINFNNAIHDFAKVSLHLHLTVSFIGVKNYEKATFWVNKLLNELHSKSIATHLLIGKILSLIIAFEQKKFTYLNFITKQYINEIDLVENRPKSLDLLIGFFYSNNFDELTKSETKKLLEKLKLDLNNLFVDSNEKIIVEVFDVLSWIDSNIYNQSFEYLIKIKFNNNL